MNEDKINSSTQLDKKKKQSKGFGGLFFCCVEKEDDDCNNNKKNTSSTTSRSTGPQSFVQLQTPSSINVKEGQQQNQQQKQQSPQQQLQFTQQQNQSTIFYQSQIYKNQGNNNYNNEDDTTEQKMMASSLDAGKIESTNKANEKKQIREAQLIHQQVKQAFPLDKMFFLRDRQNKFHSLAFCTQHFFQAPISQIQSSATRNIISNTNNLFRLGPSNTSELQKSKIINFNTRKNVQEVQDTHVKISQHIAELMKKYTTVIEAGCGQGNTTLQFSKTARIVIVVEKDMDMLMNCIDNVRMYRPEKNLNVEYICDEFLALDCPQQFALGERADLVFLKPQLFTQSDTHRLDLFRKNYQHELLDQMTHAYRLAKNMAVLLPHNIDIDQIPVLLDKFYDSLPLSMIEHHCAHIQVLYMNGAVKHFLLLIGDISKITADEEFQFMQEQIRSQSYYPRGPYEMRVLELLRTVKTRRGMKKLVNLLIKSIDLSDFQKQKNLLSCFVDELQKEKILLDKEVKRILNFSNLPASSDGLCDSFEGKRSPSGLTGNNGNNGNNNNNNNDQMHNTNRSPFVMSAPSDSQSQFEMEMQYGSRYSNSINNHNQSQGESLPVVSHTVSLQESEVNSQYKYVESSLGERLEFTDGEENEEYSDDEDGDHGGSHRKKRGHTSYKYEMDDSNIQHNQSGLDLDENSPHQQHNQKQNEKNLLEKNPPRPQLNSQINTF